MTTAIRPYVLLETNWKEVKETNYSVAILPWGATEAHNYHLPYGTDFYLAEHLAITSAKDAWEHGSKVIVLPTIPFGVNTGQIDIPLCMNMNPSTQMAVLKDVLQVVHKAGIQKLVILNAHGGNHFKQMIRELYLHYPDVFVCAINWWQSEDAQPFFEEPGDHAGEMETSAMMHVQPPLVLPLSEAGDGRSYGYTIDGLAEGWVQSQRLWTKASKDTGVGNPQHSTRDKGEKYISACVRKIAAFLSQLAATDLDDLYEK